MMLEEEMEQIFVSYNYIDIYDMEYTYEIMKLAISIKQMTDRCEGWDYEDIINLCINIEDIYMTQLSHCEEEDYSPEFDKFLKTYPQFKIQNFTEQGYIQDYAYRNIDDFIDLNLKYVQQKEKN